ncbi:hypothetical protein KIN34_10070 [Cellulomonas sp. DKR-3]|uniref:SGNH domain-containing protein n=1 Tax=Cellulomonas fulva TaxID=2835530 RepID=A0ABS5TZQ9_9CELL|nr:SGNH hydrolase domain-containing protein [Cellulomonas fulva]MBT0994633.1 hypothetical protein [Cellulomonas fulva]
MSTAAGRSSGRARRAWGVALVVLTLLVPALVAPGLAAPAVAAPASAPAAAAGAGSSGTTRYVTDLRVTGRGAPGTTRTFTGRVVGATTGSPVTVQRRTADGWVRVAKGSVGAEGRFALRARTTTYGNARYRVVAPGWHGLRATASRPRDVGAYGDVRAVLTRVLSGDVECLGAAALDPRTQPCRNPDLAGTLTPDPRTGSAWESDTQGAFACYVGEVDVPVPSCEYGSGRTDALRVAVVGDSHGAMLLPGIKAAAGKLNWRVSTYVSRGCVLAAPGPSDDPCHFRRSDLLRRLVAARYDVVLVTSYRKSSATPAGIAQAWRRLQDAGSLVVAVGDNPMVSEDLLACATGASTVAQVEACSMPRAEALAKGDALVAAHARVPGSVLVDSTNLVCAPTTCHVAVGNVLVYRDTHHLSATYARTLTPSRLAGVVAALAARQ